MKRYTQIALSLVTMQSTIRRLCSLNLSHARAAVLIYILAVMGLAMPSSVLADDASDLLSISTTYKDIVMGGNDSNVADYLALLNSSGRFTDIDYSATCRDCGFDVAVHLERSLALAQAYERPGSIYYQDADLRSDIFSTISGWISGTPTNANWWWSTIGWPSTASKVGVIMKDALATHDNNLRNSLVSYLKSASWNKIGNQAGANATDVQMVGLAVGAIDDDHNLCETVVNSMLSTINYKTGDNDGMMTDASFTQHNSHGRQLYHNGYANVYLNGFLNIATIVKDTSLRVSTDKDTLIEEFFLGGVQHLIYGEHYSDILVSGRGYAGNPTYTPTSAKWRYPLEDLIEYGTARKAELEVLHDRMMGVTPENTVANKMFWHTDFMTHTRPHYYTSVRGTSTRTSGNETLQGQAKLSYHMGDGVNMVLHHGDEYETILPVWDWRRLPGTTIEQRTGSIPLAEGDIRLGGTSYAGGVSDGKYGAYGFIFNEGSDNANVDAYKAHFFFDDEFVALGAGVSAPNAGNPVVTTVNQTLHKSDFTVGSTGAQQTYSSGSVALAKDDWVHHYDIGYLMLDHYGSTTASVATQQGRLSDHTTGLSDDLLSESVFSLGIDHGQGFSGKTYGYVVVPGVSIADMADYAASSPIQVLANSTTVQAVHHNELDITSALFYQSGSLTLADGTTLTSDKPVALLVQKVGPYALISAANPQYQSLTVKITIEGELSGSDVSYNSGDDVSTITFNLAGGNDAGKTVSLTLDNLDAGPTPDGQLFNGSFEYGALDWNIWNNPAIVSDAIDGGSALRMTDSGGGHQMVNVTPNTTYTISFFAKNSDSMNRVVVGVYDVYDNNIADVSVYDEEYTYTELTFTTDSDDTQVKVWFWQPPSNGGMAYIDNIQMAAGSGDVSPPAPNPASFEVAPVATSATTITMTSTTGIDNSAVEYLFSETSGNPGSDGSSGWQSSPTYTASGLHALTEYTYTVTMRDSLGNTGSASAGQSITTLSNLASNGSFESGLSGWTTWNNPVVVADAFEGTSAVQMTDAGSIGLWINVKPLTTYRLSAYIKNSDGSKRVVLGTNGDSNAGGVDVYGTSYTLVEKVFTTDSDTTQIEIYVWFPSSGGAIATVDDIKLVEISSTPDNEPPMPEQATFAVAPTAISSTSLTMTSTTGIDVYGVEYYFTETSGNPGGSDSGWQSSATYTDNGLSELTLYTYTVTMRDTLGNTGSASTEHSATTSATNLIINGDFESGLDNWNTWNSPANVSDSYQGSFAVEMIDKGSVGQWVDVLPSTTYRLSAYIKSSDGSNRVVLGTNGGSSAGGVDSFATTYTYIEKVITTDSSTTQIEAYIWFPSSGGAIAYADDVKLEKVNTAPDATPPVITLIGNGSMSVVQYSIFTDPGVTATDAVDGDISASVVVSGSVDINTVGTYPITYTVTDAAGNSASTTRTVTVTAYIDTVAPVITLVGASSITLELAEAYVEAGATASDNDDGNITANILISGTVNTLTAGTYLVTYSVSDAAGNSDSVTRTVTVNEQYFDIIAPVITLNGASEVSLYREEAYVEAGATASDNDDGDVTANIVISGTVDTSTVGNYTITYTVADAAGNSTSDTRNVTVIAVPVSGVSVSSQVGILSSGDVLQLSETVSPANAEDQNVTWSSDNPSVATVDSNGLVTAVAAGSATITVTTSDGSFIDTSDITVTTTHFATHIGSGKRMQSNAGGTDADAVSASNVGNLAQWILEDAGSGYYYIVNKENGMKLEGLNNNVADETSIRLTSASSTGDSVKWQLTATGSNYFIDNVGHNGRLNINGSGTVSFGSISWTGNWVQWTLSE